MISQPPLLRTCQACQSNFTIYPEDLALLEKMRFSFGTQEFRIPPPTLCPDCRNQRRLAQRNERNLYRRQCSATGKPLISIYSKDKSLQVYDTQYWHGDGWDPVQYGRLFDFERHFFPQYHDLLRAVPRMAVRVLRSENCEYNNNMEDCTNCYLCFTTFWGGDFLYTYWIGWGRDCVDCCVGLHNELCYECLDTEKCYSSCFCEWTRGCSDCYFLYDCSECHHCFCSTGLRGKSYCFRNEQLSRIDYEERLRQILPLSRNDIARYSAELLALKRHIPQQALLNSQSESGHGNYLKHTKDCFYCFDIFEGQSMRYCFDAGLGRDYMDATQIGEAGTELIYESQGGSGYHIAFCNMTMHSNECIYCDTCISCQNCFACVGLRRKQFCILNTQLSKDEYEQLVPKIIAHMQGTGEWGEFFPMQLSPFAYNESVASEYYPLSEERVSELGLAWRPPETLVQVREGAVHAAICGDQLPQRISEVDDSIVDQVILCATSGKAYKVVRQELNFYRRMGLPLPAKCPDVRYQERMAKRRPRRLHERDCSKCGGTIVSTFSSQASELAYCDQCYYQYLAG